MTFSSAYANGPVETAIDASAVTPTQTTSSKVTQLAIPHTTLTATIDGDLSDEIWDAALPISLDIVNSPYDNAPSPVKTAAKIIENGDFLYISFIAQDPNPEKIVAALANRDSRWSDELVGIKLDTANNRRLNYSFLVNPFGVQHDEVYNEMTGDNNRAWDGIWHSFGKITESGYQVEMAVPFHALNFEQSDVEKTWAFELIRVYRRDTSLRISHVPLDKNNNCWLCQYPEMVGFETASADKNLTLTPSFVAGKSQNRDIFAEEPKWQDDSNIEPGLDVRWAIDSNNLLNVTLNPDFSTIETDGGQLQVNQLDALFYEEKRPFFMENAEYFKSNFDLVYTRNIHSPDYGAKFTGANKKHTYGIFLTNDAETNYILPGNTGSSLYTSVKESHSSAAKYRYDVSDDFSVGVINTIRANSDYHNIVTGIDSKFRFDESNSILAQIVHADTKNSSPELARETDQSDYAVKLDLVHESEFWEISGQHQQIGKNFRADLGYMPKADYRQTKIEVARVFYGNENTFWSNASIDFDVHGDYSESGKQLSKGFLTSAAINGPMLSYLEINFQKVDKIGTPDIKGELDGTPYFDEHKTEVFGFMNPTADLYIEGALGKGNKIDYANNRLGDYKELWSKVVYNMTKHLEFDFSFNYGELDADNKGRNGYIEQVADARISYQFDVRSYLKLNLNYYDIEFEPSTSFKTRDKYLTTQLIYAYKLNPQTVFYIGYSDNSYRDDQLKTLTRSERTVFTKVSYAWMPN